MPHMNTKWRKPSSKYNDTMHMDRAIEQDVTLPQFTTRFHKPTTQAEVIQMMHVKNWHLRHSQTCSDPRDRKRHGDIHDLLAGVVQYSMKQLED